MARVPVWKLDEEAKRLRRGAVKLVEEAQARLNTMPKGAARTYLAGLLQDVVTGGAAVVWVYVFDHAPEALHGLELDVTQDGEPPEGEPEYLWADEEEAKEAGVVPVPLGQVAS